MKNQKIKHIPVLLKEFLQSFKDSEIKVFVDGTLGAAGHAKAILDEHTEIETFIGLDQDQVALDIANENLKEYMNKVSLFHENYKNIDKILDELNIKKCDGIFLDIGVSSMQIDSESRGFSFRFDSYLDMRMNKDSRLTAFEVINKFSQRELERIFSEYGEEGKAKKAAIAIVQERRKKKIETTFDLLKVLEPVLGKRRKIHPATKIFQALRIYVNDELNVLKEGLQKAINRLEKNGKIAVISFHSLEDRIVKHAFKEDKSLKILTKKPIVAGREERNPRARSAKLRIAIKL